MEERQNAGQAAGNQEGRRLAADQRPAPAQLQRRERRGPVEERRPQERRREQQQDRDHDRGAEHERPLRQIVGKDRVVPLDVDRRIEAVVSPRNMQQRVHQSQVGGIAEEEPEPEASTQEGERHGDHAGTDPVRQPPGPKDESGEGKRRHRPSWPDQGRGNAPATTDEQRAGEVGGERISQGRSREQRVLRRQVVAVGEGGGVAGVQRPVRPGVVVVGQPGIRRDLDGAAEQVRHRCGDQDDDRRQREVTRGELLAHVQQLPADPATVADQ